MLEIHNFWGPGLWTHVTGEGQILDRTTHGCAVPLVERDLTDRSCHVNLSLIYPFSFPALGECRFISIAAGPLPVFLSLTSRPGACLGVTPFQKASKTPPVAAVPPLLGCVAGGQDSVPSQSGALPAASARSRAEVESVGVRLSD